MQSKITAKQIRDPKMEGIGCHPGQPLNPDMCGNPCLPHGPAPFAFHSGANGDCAPPTSHRGSLARKEPRGLSQRRLGSLPGERDRSGWDALLIGLRCKPHVKFMKPLYGNGLPRVHYVSSNGLWPYPKISVENLSKCLALSVWFSRRTVRVIGMEPPAPERGRHPVHCET